MWDVFNTPFKGFGAADFEAYTEEKWASKLHNRARTSVRDKLSAIARQVNQHLAQQGATFSVDANDPHPSVFNSNRVDAQWIFLTRPEADRKRLSTILDREHSLQDNLREAAHHKRHLMFGVKVHQGGVDVMLGLHRRAAVDVRNGLKKLSDQWLGHDFNQLIEAMSGGPAGQLHLVGPTATVGFAQQQAELVHGQLMALAEGHGEWCIWGRNHPPTDPLVAEEAFGQHVAALFGALLPLYNYLLWSQENDYLALGDELKEKKALSRMGGVELAPGDAVVVTSGLFNGQSGVVQEIEDNGMVKIAVGNLTIQVKGATLQRA